MGPGECTLALLRQIIASISTYRHLAEKWANTYVNPHPARRLNPPGTMLSTIEHLILLDLLGAPNPVILSYFPSTAWMFDALIAIESRLEQSGHLRPPKGGKESLGVDRPAEQARAFRSFFKPRQSALESNGWIDDDHMPFLHQGVSTLHIIPTPFPTVWHTLKVNECLPSHPLLSNGFV